MTNSTLKRSILDIAKEINLRVKNELGFTVNIGVSNNKLLAKMASDFEKPDKIHTLFPNEIEEKMWPLPISELFGLGKKTVPKLLNLRIKTIGDLAKADKQFLISKFGKHGLYMWEVANGIDNSEVNNKFELPKSIGNSVTTPKDIDNKEDIYNIIVALAEQVSFRLRKYDLTCSTVTIQLRTSSFEDYSHQKKIGFSTSSTKDILKISKEILDEMYNNKPIRLVGLSVSNLENKDEVQISLFENTTKQDILDKTLDTIKEKYGYTSVTRASKLQVENIVKNKDKKFKN